MTFDPILTAEPVVQIHILMALVAMAMTGLIFALPRGTTVHKVTGRIWVFAMGLTAISSFWIFELQLIGKYSPVHLLSIFTLIKLVSAVRAARHGDIARHQRNMKQMAFAALLVAGAFTFFPGRTMYQVFLGG